MDSIARAWLEGLGPPVAGQRFELGQSPVRLGRGPTCQLLFDDPRVSREHAEIRYQAGRFVVRDLDSGNGTVLNGQRVIEAELSDGDHLRLGGCEFVFRLGQDSSSTMISPPSESRAGTGRSKPAQAPATHAARPAASPPPAPPANQAGARPKRSRKSRLLIVGGGLGLLALCACVGCYALFILGDFGSGVSNQTASDPPDLQTALAIETIDERPEVLARLGLPDAFTISDQEVEGGKVVFESWVYHQFGLQVDFVDGEALWTAAIDPPPAGTLFPAWYSPLDFPLGISMDEAMRLAAEKSPAGAPPAIVDLGEGSELMPNVTSLVGDQILMGFYDGRLIYVETVALEPGGGAP